MEFILLGDLRLPLSEDSTLDVVLIMLLVTVTLVVVRNLEGWMVEAAAICIPALARVWYQV